MKEYTENLTIIFGASKEELARDNELLMAERKNLIDRITGLENELRQEKAMRKFAEKRHENQLKATEMFQAMNIGLVGVLDSYKYELYKRTSHEELKGISERVNQEYMKCMKELLKTEE